MLVEFAGLVPGLSFFRTRSRRLQDETLEKLQRLVCRRVAQRGVGGTYDSEDELVEPLLAFSVIFSILDSSVRWELQMLDIDGLGLQPNHAACLFTEED